MVMTSSPTAAARRVAKGSCFGGSGFNRKDEMSSTTRFTEGSTVGLSAAAGRGSTGPGMSSGGGIGAEGSGLGGGSGTIVGGAWPGGGGGGIAGSGAGAGGSAGGSAGVLDG